jgi:hypothetical protein
MAGEKSGPPPTTVSPSRPAAKKSKDKVAAGPPVGSAATELQPIGVPAGYTAQRYNPGTGTKIPFADGFRPANAGMEDTPPRYFDGAEWAPQSMTGPQIAEIQKKLVAAGLIPKGAQYRNGYWDDVSRSAFKLLLAESNASGMAWNQQVEMRMATEEANRPTYKAPAYLKPDPATTRTGVRKLMQTIIGEDREPTDDEMAQLTSTFERFSRQEYDADVAAERAGFDAVEDMGSSGGGEVQGVDPSARFEELFRERYQPEITSRRDTAQLAENRTGLLGSIFTLDQAIGASA